MAAGAFGRATHYGWESPLNGFGVCNNNHSEQFSRRTYRWMLLHIGNVLERHSPTNHPPIIANVTRNLRLVADASGTVLLRRNACLLPWKCRQSVVWIPQGCGLRQDLLTFRLETLQLQGKSSRAVWRLVGSGVCFVAFITRPRPNAGGRVLKCSRFVYLFVCCLGRGGVELSRLHSTAQYSPYYVSVLFLPSFVFLFS